MSIRYVDGEHNSASGTRDAFGRFSDDLEAAGLPPITVSDGDREPADQVELFVTRFRQQATGNGPFGDVRRWDGSAWGYPGGTRWVRWSDEGTVAVPGTGNHEKRRSNDLAWPYNSNTWQHARAREIAKRHNITCDGIDFGEWWHWTFWGALGVIGSPASTGNATPIQQKEWYEMPLDDQAKADIRDVFREVLNEPRGKDQNQTSANIAFITAQVKGEVDETQPDRGAFQLATAIRSIATIKGWVGELYTYTRIKVHSVWARMRGRDPRDGLGEKQLAEFDRVEPNEKP